MSGIKLWLAAGTLVVFALSLSTNIPALKTAPASAKAAQPSAASREAGGPNQVPGVVTLTKTGPATACAGSEDIVYSITATNGLSVVLTNITITDVLPACLSFSSAATTSGNVTHNPANNTVTVSSITPMAPNASVTVSITTRATPGCAAQVTNSASITYFPGNPTRPQEEGGGNGIATQTITSNTVTTTIKAHPGQPAVSASQSTVFGSQFQAIPLGLSVSLTNPNGTETVQVTISGVPATATLSAGINQGGGSWLLTQADLNGLTLTDTAIEFFSLQPAARAMDPNACSTPTDYVTLNVFISPAIPNITLVKAGPANICAGSMITYTINANNSGGNAGNVQLTDVVPACLTGIQAAASQGSVVVQNNTVTANLGTVAAQSSATVTITATVGTACGATISNQATVIYDSGIIEEREVGPRSPPGPVTSNVVNTNVHQPPGTPSITTSPASGNKGVAIPLSITQTVNNPNGSESVIIQVAGVPATAILSAGTNTGNGIWTLNPAQLNGLTLTDSVGETFNLVVTATASANASCQNTTGMGSLTVTVIDNTPPILILSGPIGNPNPGIPDFPVTFTATTSPANATLSWNFGDGSPAGTGSPVTHVYTAPGSYTVVVTATHPTSGQTATGSTVEVITDQNFIPGTIGFNFLQGHLTFGKPDHLHVLGILELSGGSTVPSTGDGLTFTIDGLTETFTLDQYGHGVATDGARIRLRAFKFATTGAPRLKLFIQLRGAFKAQLIKNALLDERGFPRKAIVVIEYKGKTYSSILSLTFKKSTARFGFVLPEVLVIPTPNPQ